MVGSGNIDLTRILPFLGKTELEVLSVVGSFLLVFTHGVTAYCTKEKVVVASKLVPQSPFFSSVLNEFLGETRKDSRMN